MDISVFWALKKEKCVNMKIRKPNGLTARTKHDGTETSDTEDILTATNLQDHAEEGSMLELVEAPIIWHNLPKTPHGILRQALMNTEKEVKHEEATAKMDSLFADAGGEEVMKALHGTIILDGNKSPLNNKRCIIPVKRTPSTPVSVDKDPLFAAPLDRPPTPASIQIVAGLELKTPPAATKIVRAAQPTGPEARFPHFDLIDEVPPVEGQLAGEGSEYTDHLLSELSVVLPTMSCSQVSSLLSALEPTTPQAEVAGNDEANKRKKPANGESPEFVKVEGQKKQMSPKKKPRSSPSKCVGIEMKSGKVIWYKCGSCGFLSVDKSTMYDHCDKAQSESRSSQQHQKTRLRCLGCSNVFMSPQSLSIHLIVDHDVLMSDIQELTLACIKANKTWASKQDKGENGEDSGNFLELPATPGLSLFESVHKYIADCNGDSREVGGRGSGKRKLTENKESSESIEVEKDGRPTESLSSSATMSEKELANKCLTKQSQSSQVVKRTVKQEPRQSGDSKEASLRCSIDGCSARFVFSSNLDYHQLCHQGLKWKCPECDVMYPSWNTLSVHLWRQHAVDMELYSCDQCSYKTNSLSKLMNLHRRIHGEERPFLCDLCGKGFKTTKQLRNHKNIHRDKEKMMGNGELDCGICGRGFSNTKMLSHHMDIVHRKLRPFLCSVCGHAAASRSSLRMHTRMHTGEKPYRCTECDYMTSDHNSLRRHKMKHSGAKHYTCPHCPYASIQSSTYKVHLKNKHPGLDEGLIFSCELCSFRTVKKDNFLTHASCHVTDNKHEIILSSS